MRGTGQQGGSDCQVVGGKRIDQAVVEVFLDLNGGPCRIRTYDHRIKSPLYKNPVFSYILGFSHIYPMSTKRVVGSIPAIFYQTYLHFTYIQD
jgi:hypothetical protein